MDGIARRIARALLTCRMIHFNPHAFYLEYAWHPTSLKAIVTKSCPVPNLLTHKETYHEVENS